jgi:hypothetical protein
MQKPIIIVKTNNLAKKIDKLHESAKRINKGDIPQRFFPHNLSNIWQCPWSQEHERNFFEPLDQTGCVRTQNLSENNT